MEIIILPAGVFGQFGMILFSGVQPTLERAKAKCVFINEFAMVIQRVKKK